MGEFEPHQSLMLFPVLQETLTSFLTTG